MCTTFHVFWSHPIVSCEEHSHYSLIIFLSSGLFYYCDQIINLVSWTIIEMIQWKNLTQKNDFSRIGYQLLLSWTCQGEIVEMCRFSVNNDLYFVSVPHTKLSYGFRSLGIECKSHKDQLSDLLWCVFVILELDGPSSHSLIWNVFIIIIYLHTIKGPEYFP